jgi:molybdopterin synthase catalytic subunit
MTARSPTVRVQAEDFDPPARSPRLDRRARRRRRGGDLHRALPRRGRPLAALELEHYPGMAEAEIAASHRGAGALAA